MPVVSPATGAALQTIPASSSPRLITELFGWKYPEWYDDGACRDLPLSIFFGAENATDTQLISPGELRRAQEICGSCPVRAKCLSYALERKILHGVWAGTSGRTRARIWAMERRGEVSREQVLTDYAAGRSGRYERLRRPQMSASISR